MGGALREGGREGGRGPRGEGGGAHLQEGHMVDTPNAHNGCRRERDITAPKQTRQTSVVVVN